MKRKLEFPTREVVYAYAGVRRGPLRREEKAYSKLWRGDGAMVGKDKQGGLVYVYDAYRHDTSCAFTLWYEVGEPYKHLFDGFFEKYEVEGFVEYPGHPYCADKLKGLRA